MLLQKELPKYCKIRLLLLFLIGGFILKIMLTQNSHIKVIDQTSHTHTHSTHMYHLFYYHPKMLQN